MGELDSQTPLTQGVCHTKCQLAPFIYRTVSGSPAIRLPQRLWYGRVSGKAHPLYIGSSFYMDRYFYIHIVCWGDGMTHIRHHNMNINNILSAVVIDKPFITIKNKFYTLYWNSSQTSCVSYTPDGITASRIARAQYISSVTFDGKHLSLHCKSRTDGTTHIKRIFIRE